ncbi:MAG: Cof-type HAD-IIB family hydrolase [Actinomycetota bacterium]
MPPSTGSPLGATSSTRGRLPALIVSDLDGTLLGADGRLSVMTIDVLRRARATGITVVAATGRAPRSAMPRVGHQGVIDGLVCSNGAIVHDPVRDRVVERRTIPPEDLTATFDALDDHLPDASCCWELGDGRGGVTYDWDEAFDPIGSTHEDTRRQRPHRPARRHGARPAGSTDVSKLMILHPELTGIALRDVLRPILPSRLTLGCSGVPFVEVTAAGVDKASTVARIAARLGIGPHDVVAFGDNANDLELLAWAGLGLAVDNAVDEAKRVADDVIGHHADDSVARWIEARLDRAR